MKNDNVEYVKKLNMGMPVYILPGEVLYPGQTRYEDATIEKNNKEQVVPSVCV